MHKILVVLQHKHTILAETHFPAEPHCRENKTNNDFSSAIRQAMKNWNKPHAFVISSFKMRRRSVWFFSESRTCPIKNKNLILIRKNTIKKLLMNILNDMIVNMNFYSIMTVFIMTIHEELISKFLQVPLKQTLMGSWLSLDSSAVLVRAHLPRIN